MFLFLRLLQISFFIFNRFHSPLICRAVEYHVPANADSGGIDTFFPIYAPSALRSWTNDCNWPCLIAIWLSCCRYRLRWVSSSVR